MKEKTAEEYFEWLRKFEQKYTTDECYTPPAVYEEIKEYVVKFFGLEGKTIERPFYPNGDYKKAAESYDENTVVIDNPPFSLTAEIIKTYQALGVRFFLFTQMKTALHHVDKGVSVWFMPHNIIYDRGIRVCTAFLTNLEKEQCIRTIPNLIKPQSNGKKSKNSYPENLYIASHFQRLSKAGNAFMIPISPEMIRRTYVDEKRGKVQIYGGGVELPSGEYKKYIEELRPEKSDDDE